MTTNYSNPTLAETALSATVVEAVLYGLSVPMFAATLWVLLRGRHWRDVHYAMLAAASVLFISSTAHIGISAGRLGIFLFEIGDDYPGGPTAWFYDPSHQTFATKNILLLLETLVADAVVIYRCYIVWQAIWVVVLPIVLWIGIAVSGSANIYHARYLHTNQDPQRRVYIAWFMACSLSCNIIAIGFLAYRLWRAHADASSIRSGKDVIFPVLRIVLDAGALYSSALICSIIVYLLRFPAQFIAVDITPSVIAIAFYMVFLRVGLARRTTTSATSCSSPRFAEPSQPESQYRASSTVRSSMASEPMAKPVAIHVQVERSRNSAPLSALVTTGTPR